MKVGIYHSSYSKKILDLAFSLVVITLSLPFMFLISLLILATSGPGIFFYQKRIGKGGRVFKIIKFRTMINGAENMQKQYKYLNESDGPAFKIKDDPRFTRIGKILSRTGLDELPQFINVLIGDMSVVGPRPLPVSEAKKIAKGNRIREKIKPGITSTWVVNGSHKLKFRKWMKLDEDYVKNATFTTDLQIIFNTLIITIGSLLKLLKPLTLTQKVTSIS